MSIRLVPPRTADLPPAAVDDPEIAALLEFEPVPRKVNRPDGWTPERQRSFIRLIVETGTPQQAAAAMGKQLSGIEPLYRQEDAESFRAAWDSAVVLAAKRQRDGLAGIGGGGGSRTPPHRRGAEQPWEAEDEPEMGAEEKMAMVANLARKFMRKVMAEREARLAGEIVAADFYLRQVTMLEVGFDLLTEGVGLDAWQMLRECRRGEHGVLEIVETPLSRELDKMRRDYWRDSQEPERPEHPPERYTELQVARRGGPDGAEYDEEYRTEPLQAAYGGCSRPAAGYSQEQWAEMDYEGQVAARKRQYEQDAAAQAHYERAAYEEWRSNLSAEAKANDGEADALR